MPYKISLFFFALAFCGLASFAQKNSCIFHNAINGAGNCQISEKGYCDKDNFPDSLFVNLDEFAIVLPKTSNEIIPSHKLEKQDLQRLNAHSVADAVRFFSGAKLKDYGGIGGLKTIDVRAMGSSHVGVFYDGIEIGTAQNGIVDLGRFSLDNIESVSLYNGQKSNILQSAKDFSSASSLYLQSRAPTFQGKLYNLKFSMKTGAFDLINPSLTWDQKISGNFSSSFNAEYTYSSGKYKYTYSDNWWTGNGYKTTDKRRNGDIEIFRAEQAFFGASSDLEWKTRLYFYASERGYPGAVIRESKDKLQYEDRQKDKSFFAQASAKKILSNSFTTQVSAKYAVDNIHYKSDSTAMKVDNTYKLQDFYISSANLMSLTNWWSINLSADYQNNKMNSNMKDFIYPLRNNLLCVAASSFCWPKLKAQGSLLYSFSDDKTKKLGNLDIGEKKYRHKKYEKLSPSFVASFQPWGKEQLYFHYFYKDIFRMPTFTEIYMSFMSTLSSFLKPETSRQNNLGVSYSKRISSKIGIEAQIDGYLNKVKNKIMAIGGGSNFRWTILNKGLVKIKGIDISFAANYEPKPELKLIAKATYTYQKAQDFTPKKVESDSIYYGGQIPYIPWNSSTFILSGSWKQWDFNYSMIYTGVRYTSSSNTKSNKMDSWNTHDMSVSRNFDAGWGQARATIEINNIFNKQYEIVTRYPMPGTNFKFIFRLTI